MRRRLTETRTLACTSSSLPQNAAKGGLLMLYVAVRSGPGRAKAEFKLAAVNQSAKAGQQGKLCADGQGPVMADCGSTAVQAQGRLTATLLTFKWSD